ncbi:MAG: hypothetical protein AAFX99_26525, partial [Myxococcota bacterium]
MDIRTTINTILLPAGVFIGLIMAVGLTSMAEDSELDTGPRVIPYNGVLEFNGSPLNGQADLMFTLTDDPSGENVNCLFEEEHGDVSAYAGRFSVNIGSVVGDLPSCAFDSDAMYIEVGVREAESDGEYVALSGSQRIHPVPFSYWAAEGSDFKIDGALNVSGAISDPDSAVTIDDDLTVSGTIEPSAGNSGIDWPDNPFGGGGDSAWIRYYQDGSGEDAALQIGIGNDGVDDLEFFQNGQVRAYIANNFFIDTNLRLSGNIQGTDGDLILSDNTQITGVLDVRGNIQDDNDNEVTINDSLNVTNDVTVGSDGSGNLTVNGDIDGVGNLDTGGVTMGDGNITYDSKFFVSGGDVHVTGNIEHDGDSRLGSGHWPACITFRTNDDNETGNTLCACMSTTPASGHTCTVNTSNNRDFTLPGT